MFANTRCCDRIPTAATVRPAITAAAANEEDTHWGLPWGLPWGTAAGDDTHWR